MGSVDVAGFVHVLNHTEFDTVALALYVLDLRDGFRSAAHGRTCLQRSLGTTIIQQQCRTMLGVVRILAHLVNKPTDNMMNRLDLQFAGARENLVLAHQWCGVANLGHRAFGVIAHLPLEHA